MATQNITLSSTAVSTFAQHHTAHYLPSQHIMAQYLSLSAIFVDSGKIKLYRSHDFGDTWEDSMVISACSTCRGQMFVLSFHVEACTENN